MIWIIITAIVLAAVSFYDFSWSNATNNIRNEVVFENRHKTYGAYALRVEYGRQLIVSFIVVTLVCGGFLYASKYIGGTKGMAVIDNKKYTDIDLTKLNEKVKPKEQVYKIPTKTIPPPKFDMFKLFPPKAKNEPEVDSLPVDMKNKMAGSVNAKGDSTSKNTSLVLEDLPIDKKCNDCPPEEKTYGDTDVEELPEFAGLIKYLQKNVKYPADAREIGIQGKVYVEFTVMKDGRVVDVKVKNRLFESLDREAARVIREMPATWTPGKINGHPVSVRVKQPINFKLNNSK